MTTANAWDDLWDAVGRRGRGTSLPSGFAGRLSVLQHLRPNLDGRRGHCDQGTPFIPELSGEEADVAASLHNAVLAVPLYLRR